VASLNERKTEQLVRAHFTADPFPDLIIDEQKTDDRRINVALSKASKAGSGIGRPEFIIHAPSLPNLVILVECKASTKQHESSRRGRPKDFAVDGVLHYAKFVSTVRDVVAVAVSGETAKEIRVSAFLQLRGAQRAAELLDKHGPIESLTDVATIVNAVRFDPLKRDSSLRELLAFSRDLHDKMREDAKLTDQEKPLVVSGILIGLTDKIFSKTYTELDGDEIGDQLLEAITRELKRAALPHAKVQRIVQPYSFIANHEWLNVVLPRQSATPLQTYCADLAEHVLPYVSTYGEEDVVGRFYGEFLRYAGDKKGLGIVLTPRHVTELFCDLADLSVSDTVIDPCAGTAAFLIAAMTRMDGLAKTESEHKDIRERHLVGIEQQAMMFALAASNMLLRGDGKANLYHRSGLDPKTQSEVINSDNHPRPTKGMVNPPYSQKGDGLHELDFVEAMLHMLAPGGIGIAVVPMSCGIQPSTQKHRLMEQHTLLAAMSMPDQLFYPVAAVTCILVFQAHHPHAASDIETWFGYWKDDGYRITRIYGRSDADQRWQGIRTGWIRDYKQRSVAAGRDVLRKVGPGDEWCAEAYMETDYSVVDEDTLALAARKYAIYLATAELASDAEDGDL
jgi:type I restriction enzyme M protein